MARVRLTIAVCHYKSIVKKLLKRVQNFDSLVIADQLNISYSASSEKKKGINRTFTYDEIAQLVELYGTQIEQKKIAQFLRVRDALYKHLKTHPLTIRHFITSGAIKNSPEQRRGNPDSWRIEELITIGKYLDTLPGFHKYIDI